MIHQRWCGIAEGNDDVALVEGDRRVSFRELLEIEGNLASELQRRGVEADDAVGVVEFLAQLLGEIEISLALGGVGCQLEYYRDHFKPFHSLPFSMVKP